MTSRATIRIPTEVTPELQEYVRDLIGANAEVLEVYEEIAPEGQLNISCCLAPVAEKVFINIDGAPLHKKGKD
jgi:hypothetical protein